MSPGSLVTFWKEGSWERMKKLPLESFWASASRTLTQSHFSLTVVNVQTTRIQRAFQDQGLLLVRPQYCLSAKVGKGMEPFGLPQTLPFLKKKRLPCKQGGKGNLAKLHDQPRPVEAEHCEGWQVRQSRIGRLLAERQSHALSEPEKASVCACYRPLAQCYETSVSPA